MKTYNEFTKNLAEEFTDADLKKLEKCLFDSKNNIKQLCDMVNNYSGKLGLGRKVRAEDFYEKIDDAMKLIKK